MLYYNITFRQSEIFIASDKASPFETPNCDLQFIPDPRSWKFKDTFEIIIWYIIDEMGIYGFYSLQLVAQMTIKFYS